jgi:hypothetical protein
LGRSSGFRWLGGEGVGSSCGAKPHPEPSGARFCLLSACYASLTGEGNNNDAKHQPHYPAICTSLGLPPGRAVCRRVGFFTAREPHRVVSRSARTVGFPRHTPVRVVCIPYSPDGLAHWWDGRCWLGSFVEIGSVPGDALMVESPGRAEARPYDCRSFQMERMFVYKDTISGGKCHLII